MHYFTSIFDLTIVIWMMYGRFRPWASLFCVAFHLMNSSLFSIGMFPWVCLTQMPLFFERDWPRKWALFKTKQKQKIKVIHEKHFPNSTNKRKPQLENYKWTRTKTCSLFIYCSLQAVLPYSHFLTPGFNTWTDGPYGYSWDMMMHAWNTVRTSVRVRDNTSGEDFFLNAKSFAYSDRWSKHADMAHQFVKCVNQQLVQDHFTNHQSPLHSSNVSIYLDVWCSLNGRFQQRIFDPYVDILTAPWSPWQPTNWVLPIISSLLPKRSQVQKLSKLINYDNKASDVMFFGDFPGFAVEHRVSEELKEVSMTLMQGKVTLQKLNSPEIVLTTGMKVPIDSGKPYMVRTLGDNESGIMYEFSNHTLLREIDISAQRNGARVVSYTWMLLSKRCKNYERFLRNIVFSVFSEIYSFFCHISMLI